MSNKKAVAYARFSSDMQREESIDAQLRAIREFAEREDYDIVGVYTDEAISGKSDEREDFQNMIAAAMNSEFDYILVHKFSRFARNKFDSVLYKKRLRDIGVRVLSVTQKIDDTPEGAMLESIIESMDEYYTANLALEVMKGLRENALKGGKTGGKPPLGYSYDENGRLTPNDQAFLVRMIFDMYINGYGKRLIANTLNEQGYRSQTGKEFRARTIGDILNNEKYIGTFVYHLQKQPIIIEKNHPAIISHDMWEKKCTMHQKKYKPRMDSTTIYGLTGKMYCGVCGDRFSGGGHKKLRDGSTAYYYVCNSIRSKDCNNKSVNKGYIENYVCTFILNRILNENVYEQISIAYDKALFEYENRKPTISIEKLKKERIQLNKKKERYLDLYADGMYTKDVLYDKTAGIDKQLKAIDRQLEAAKDNGENRITKEEIIEQMKYFAASFDEADKHLIKALMDTFVDNVTVNEKNIEITFKVDFDTEKGGGLRHASGGANDGHARAILPLAPPFFIKPIIMHNSITRKDLKRHKGIRKPENA